MLLPGHEPSGERRNPSGLDIDGLEHLLIRVQDGVVSRRQLRELGACDHDIARMVRRRDLVAAHPGVYVAHTGELTWVERAWVAVLGCWPAALSHQSALPNSPSDGLIHVAIHHRRSVRAPARVVVHRMADFDERTNWMLSPPRVRLEHTAVDVALTKASVVDKFRVLADACQTRETTAGAILDALTSRRRVADRSLLVELLEDLATGACSVLEREYLRLERAHGLPDARRQLADRLAGRTVHRDVAYADFGVTVELDGMAFHDNARARDDDAERDLDTLVAADSITVRLTYRQVFDRGCETIAKIAALLRRRGWPGPFAPCPDCP
jgi:hypothetical protein